MRRARSTRWTPSASRRPAPISAPGAPPAWVRAARAACGTPRDRLRPHGEPDIARIDLAGPLLDLAAWGADPDTFAWFEAPAGRARSPRRARCCSASARSTVRALTPLGRRMQALPLPPRLARILIEAGGARDAARACAILSERQLAPTRRETTTCDLLGSLDAWASLPPHVHQVARQIEDLAAGLAPAGPRGALHRSGPAAGAVRRLRRSPRPGAASAQGTTLVLATGTGAVLGRESGVRDGEFLVALDVQAPTRPGDPNALVRVASRVEPEWIVPTADCRRTRLRSPQPGGSVPGAASASIASSWPSTRRRPSRRPPPRSWPTRGWPASPTQRTPPGSRRVALRRPRCRRADAGPRQAARGVASLADIDLAAHAPYALTRELDRLAPARLDLPSGRRTALDLRGRRQRLGVRQAAGAVRAGRDAARRPCGHAGRAVAARAERPSGADHARSAQLLGSHVSRGAQGAARTLSAASVARRSLDGDADGPRQAARPSVADARTASVELCKRRPVQ